MSDTKHPSFRPLASPVVENATGGVVQLTGGLGLLAVALIDGAGVGNLIAWLVTAALIGGGGYFVTYQPAERVPQAA